jgi:hypothetical protein
MSPGWEPGKSAHFTSKRSKQKDLEIIKFTQFEGILKEIYCTAMPFDDYGQGGPE